MFYKLEFITCTCKYALKIQPRLKYKQPNIISFCDEICISEEKTP